MLQAHLPALATSRNSTVCVGYSHCDRRALSAREICRESSLTSCRPAWTGHAQRWPDHRQLDGRKLLRRASRGCRPVRSLRVKRQDFQLPQRARVHPDGAAQGGKARLDSCLHKTAGLSLVSASRLLSPRFSDSLDGGCTNRWPPSWDFSMMRAMLRPSSSPVRIRRKPGRRRRRTTNAGGRERLA